jgi:diketogulonate reductase-like aldo/keto reductase
MRSLAVLLLFMAGGMMNLFASSNPVEVDIKSGVCRIDKVEYPIVGYGTYPLTGKVCAAAVEQAIQAGCRIIDTATYYRNFDGIARALKNKERSHFYLISKVWHDQQSPENLRKDLEATLATLQTDYLDAYLLHWPNSKMPIEKTLTAMNELRLAKKIRHIGLSNISVNHLKRVLEMGVPITWVQVEMHSYFCDFELIKFCHEHSIAVQAWAPLGLGRISQDSALASIGQKYGKNASQVAIRWIMQHGCIPLPGSKNEKHICENIYVNDFILTQDEMSEIDKRAKGERERFTQETVGFEDEFDFSYEQCWPN